MMIPPVVHRQCGPAEQTQRGMSLVELMVGLLVGLIIALAITSSVGAISKQFRITGAGAAAGESAQVALGLIDRDIRMAGAELFGSSIGALCPGGINMYRNGAVIFDGEPLGSALPSVRIIDGGDAAPDAIELLLSDPAAPGSRATGVVKEALPPNSSVLKMTESRNQLAVGDLVLVVHPPTNPPPLICTLIQITNLTGTCNDKAMGCNLNYNAGQSEYNPPNPVNTYSKPQSYGAGSLVIPAGSLLPPVITRYTVQCNALLRHDAANLPDCDGTAHLDNAIAGDVVMLKAQYGIATNATPPSDAIGSWKNAADTTADELARVKAIRVAIVARSRQADTDVVTAAAPEVFGDDLTLDLSATSVPAGKTWQNFRYRVFETVTPVRNSVWNR